jgi:membrane-bound serine protease (ClpP class)
MCPRIALRQAAVFLLAFAALASGAEVLTATVTGVIGPASARFMVRMIDRAEREQAACLVFELDTPGGLDEAMRVVIQRTLVARVPVVVYVAPSGARAASAGTFIGLAAHVLAMAPGTTIGAAHPVAIGAPGAEADETMAKKATNDAAAYIRSLAAKHNRNAVWAEAAVRDSAALSESEAVSQQVADLVAPSLTDLLAALDGREVSVGDGKRVLATKGLPVTAVAMSWREQVLSLLSHPNVAYILFMIGLLGIYFEFSNPGALLPGVVGAIALILAFFAFQTLPVNYAGALLIILAVVLFILDVKAATHGVLTAGGLVAMFMGSLMLFSAPDPALRVSLQVIVPVVLVCGAFFLLGAWLSIRACLRKPESGASALVGQEGEARTPVGQGGGTVFAAGAHWNAVAQAGIPAGVRVKVVAVRGMVLQVEALR